MIERPTLVVMARTPRIGEGKTRLAAEVGQTEAWRVNSALHAHTMSVARAPDWDTLLCVTPDDAMSDLWPKDIPRQPQGEGDLGQRLARVLAPCGNVAVIGTDCPELTRAHIADAFAALDKAPFALGPAEDGGFWLLAARDGAAAARAMKDVRWSSAHAAQDVLRNLGGEVAILPTLYDIDTADDLRRWRR